ncbi:hypothetical protein EON65_05610 [archaeon]|nr:MAG: hypothetical protein EON65_05610 [archaeon]
MMKFKRAVAPGTPECSIKCSNNFLIAVLVTVCVFTGVLLHLRGSRLVPQSNNNNNLSTEEYQQLLSKAHQLIKKYKQLRGNSTIPEDLVFKLPYAALIDESASASPQSDVESEKDEEAVQLYALPSSARDAVMGMAQDTDPKNLVSLAHFHSQI